MKISDKTDFDCETCVLSKSTNTRNREPDIRATKPFELIHTDLAGPVDPVSKDGFRYAMIFVDDYSSCTFTYFIKEKSDAVKATEKFFADTRPYGKIKTLNFHTEITPKGETETLRSDNGGEYISEEFKALLTKYNIKHELTSPYSPHQNGTSERNWRTLFEMARSLLIDSGLPKYLWTYALMTASHIRNRCYVQRIKSTPHSLITGRKPNISQLHIFGTVCYSYNQNSLKKLDSRCKKGYFVGYDRNSPSYLVYYPENRTVMKHRLVKFTDRFEQTKDESEPDFHIDQSETPEVKLESLEPKTEPFDSVSAQPSPTKSYPLRNRQQPKSEDPNNTDSINHVDFCYHIKTPNTYHEAVTSDEAPNWINAMDNEIQSLKSNETFILTNPPNDRSIVQGKWVYKVKGDPDQPTFKARYVAKGYSQVPGTDYTETFSPTARMETIRTLMQIAVQEDLTLHQMDVKTAYLHAPIDEDIYVSQPSGYTIGTKVWKLQKSLYGLKQSGRNWHKLLCDYLINELDFIQSNSDPCLFSKRNEGDTIIIIVWVDDIIIAANTIQSMKSIKSDLSSKFQMKDLGQLSTFLGIKFDQHHESISMSQSHYLENVLKTFGFNDCRPRTTPCEQNINAYAESTGPTYNNHQYRQMVGSLIYAMTCTRPDLSFVVTKLSQHLSNPNAADCAMLRHVFQYVKQTVDYKLTFHKSSTDLRIHSFSDSDWASSIEDRPQLAHNVISTFI